MNWVAEWEATAAQCLLRVCAYKGGGPSPATPGFLMLCC
uniref:Uncharacterized protein n=1 Tax=Trichinella nativa TaxID=6335 RepID=A0A0V1ILZ6_9BILA